jgi:hypothetical protein
MDATKIAELAAALKSAHGPRAAAEASRKQREYEQSGNKAEAENWRRIAGALSTTAAPHQG